MAYIRKDTVKEDRIQECYCKESDITTRYTFKYNKMVKSEITYGKGYLSPEQELEKFNAGKPKTRMKYLTEENKLVGYLTAKKLGLI